MAKETILTQTLMQRKVRHGGTAREGDKGHPTRRRNRQAQPAMDGQMRQLQEIHQTGKSNVAAHITLNHDSRFTAQQHRTLPGEVDDSVRDSGRWWTRLLRWRGDSASSGGPSIGEGVPRRASVGEPSGAALALLLAQNNARNNKRGSESAAGSVVMGGGVACVVTIDGHDGGGDYSSTPCPTGRLPTPSTSYPRGAVSRCYLAVEGRIIQPLQSSAGRPLLQVRSSVAGDNLCSGALGGGVDSAAQIIPAPCRRPHTISATSRPALGDRELVETPPKTRLLPARHVVCALLPAKKHSRSFYLSRRQPRPVGYSVTPLI
ncbi:hypothetical protein DE146DRAFT_631458 [Phaeosphaeria sp. MPI-PUGE-AT-0046c]|nr:hypothetical protein DE146DRAFT_631458 [Phaeosphaeria sp. MPI-PUGE-AT-0046c]